MTHQAKVFPYILIIPSRPSPPIQSPSPVDDDADDKNEERKKCSCSSGENCNCLTMMFAGLGLVGLLSVLIAVPLVITLSMTGTSTSSMSSTTFSTTVLSSTTTATTTMTTSTTTDDISDYNCTTTCTSQQTCVQGTCVGIGYLSFTLTWSRSGDGDIVVKTPNNKIIYFNNKGPSSATDQGRQDVDKTTGTGPENVFWQTSGPLPPNGTYYVCFSQYNFGLTASLTKPITATVTVAYSSNTVLTYTKNFTSYYKNYGNCNTFSDGFLCSVNYP